MINGMKQVQTSIGVIDPGNYDDVVKVADYIKNGFKISAAELPQIGIICGSGLGGLADQVADQKIIPYKDIPAFPETRVVGHKGQLVLGNLEGKRVVCMQGRFHPYEGHPLAQCALPVRVMKQLGVDTLMITNAAGGLNPHFKTGDLMVLNDHMFMPALACKGPLVGHNDDRIGPRFPNLNNAYDKELRELAFQVAKENGTNLREGVYMMVGGPQYETPAENRLLRTLGADAVGMSVCHETVTARHCGLRVFAMSLITNMGDIDSNAPEKADLHKEVIQKGMLGAQEASALIKGLIAKMQNQ